MTELAPFLDKLPPWVLPVLAAVVFANYIARAAAESSETWARILGPVGRRWRSRAARRAEGEAEDIRVLKRQVSNLAREVNRLTAKDQERREFEDKIRAYLTYDGTWHFRAQIAAASSGATLPDHLSFTEWERTTYG